MFQNRLFDSTYLLILSFLMAFLFLSSGCNQNSDQREFEKAAFSEPTGITETNERGDIIGNEDPDDWRIAPFFQGDIELITPPFPNPVQSNDRLTINIHVNFIDRISGIYIRVYHFGSIEPVDQREQVTTGTTTFTIDPRIIAGGRPNPAGLYRLIIQDETQNVITYGDIEIE